MLKYSFIFIATMSLNIFASSPWIRDAKLPGQMICEIHHEREVCFSDKNNKNVYNLSPSELEMALDQGAKFTLNYPVNVTRLRLPVASMNTYFNEETDNPLRRLFFKLGKRISSFKSFMDIFNWLGLHTYPEFQEEIGPNLIPDMGEIQDKYSMGASILKSSHGEESMSFSCATCHSENLFGKRILGLTNRFPRANEAFLLGKKVLTSTPSFLYKLVLNPSEHDLAIFEQSKSAMNFVGVVKPRTLGLDTSLPQVALSLHKRQKDEYATLKHPRRQSAHPLLNRPADSKPAVWWNLKYKTRWLSDGSIVSGNPIHTNFLWNEIGRGVDLKKLEIWLENNKQKVKDLTAYVFHTEAPIFNDFFPGQINLQSAIRGQKLFLKNCSGCHGKYEKNWELKNSNQLSYSEKIKTKKIWYHTQTKTVNVGTDPYRFQGMKYFYKDLNRLKISRTIGTVVKPQDGYIPPPLVGIWARWPYFHNNSVSSLYEVLTPDTKRLKKYIAVPARDKEVDFDLQKNGYPHMSEIRSPYKTDPDYLYDTSKAGMSNMGHTHMLLDENSEEKFSHQDKLDLIQFLQTL